MLCLRLKKMLHILSILALLRPVLLEALLIKLVMEWWIFACAVPKFNYVEFTISLFSVVENIFVLLAKYSLCILQKWGAVCIAWVWVALLARWGLVGARRPMYMNDFFCLVILCGVFCSRLHCWLWCCALKSLRAFCIDCYCCRWGEFRTFFADNVFMRL